MKGMSLLTIFAIVCITQANATEFPNIRVAATSFATNSVERRIAAINYVTSVASSAKSSQVAIESISALKGMFVLQGDKESFERTCRTLASSDNVYISHAAMSALFQILAERGEYKECELLQIRMLEIFPYDSQGLARRFASINASVETVEKAISIMRSYVILGNKGDPRMVDSRIERIQQEIIDMLMFMEKFEEALAECRVWMFVQVRSYQRAIEKAADVMRRADRNLGRATTFLKFHEKGYVPEGREPLLEFPRLSDEVRIKERKELAKFYSESWNDYLAAYNRALFADDPIVAVSFALKAFALAPFDEMSLQKCTDAVVRPFMVATRDPDIGKKVVEYLSSGQGEDPVTLAEKIFVLKDGARH